MNDTKQDNRDSRSLAPVVGFALGALVGAGLALLFAPESGEHTRRRIRNAARKLSREARQGIEDARETVGEVTSGMGADIKSAIDAGQEAFRHGGEQRAASRVAQKLSPPSHSS